MPDSSSGSSYSKLGEIVVHLSRQIASVLPTAASSLRTLEGLGLNSEERYTKTFQTLSLTAF